MVVTLLMWVYQLFIILPFGFLLLTVGNKREERGKIRLSSFTLAFLLGIAVLTGISSLFSLIINLGWQVHVFVLSAAVLIWIFLFVSKRLPSLKYRLWTTNILQRFSLAFLLLALGITLLSATTTPENPDTGIYHAQAIRWIETYKAVPGLGNLHERFAYNSSWLVINALFSLSFLKLQSFHILPSLLFLIAILYFFRGIFSIAGGSKKVSDYLKAAFFIASFLLLQPEISSPGTDMPVTLIIWFLIIEWVKQIEEPQTQEKNSMLWLATIAIYCATIKLSSAPILLLVVWVLISELRKKHFSIIWQITLSGLLIFLPLIGRNIIISGHLFYPGLSFDPIHVDWGIPQNQVEAEKSVIHWFALLPRVQREVFQTMTWQEQYKAWFFNQIPRHQAMLVVMILLPLVEILLLLISQWRQWLKEHLSLLYPILTAYAGVAFWLISAPTFRFGYGFILSAISLAGLPLLLFFVQMRDRILLPTNIAGGLAVALVLMIAARGAVHPKTLLSRLLLPQDYPVWPTEKCDFANFSIECQTEYDSCWYAPFPCAIRGNLEVEMRGLNTSDGFRILP